MVDNVEVDTKIQTSDAPRYRFKYPFNEMTQQNDSFFVPFTGDGVKDAKLKTSVRAAAHQYGHRHGMKFVTRAVIENGVQGLRVWRLL